MSPVKSVTYLSERTVDLSIRIKDIGKGGMRKDVPNRRSAMAECRLRTVAITPCGSMTPHAELQARVPLDPPALADTFESRLSGPGHDPRYVRTQ
jgi:hypothetical protein